MAVRTSDTPKAGAALILLLAGALAAQQPPPQDLKPGLVGEYFYTGERLLDFPALEPGAKPRFKRVDKRIDFDRTLAVFHGTKLKDDFYIRWTGFVQVAKPGKWKFSTISDDGSRLRIGGRVVVENGGTHEMREASGEVDLEAGTHPLAIDYFERYGPAGIRILWEGPGQNREVVNPAALFHAAAAEPSEEEKKGIDLAVEEPPRRETKPEPGKTAEKPKEDPRREPERVGGPFDEKIVAKGEPAPDFTGRVSSVFPDGPTTLLSVRRAAEERPVFVTRATKVVYVDFPNKAEEKPAAGYGAYVWFKPGSADQAAVVKFTR